jgi:hypothetical protein
MADINNNTYVVDKFGRTKVMENDFWRSYTANLPTGIATLKPTGAATDTTNYVQHLSGIFVGETDGTVYLGHGLKGNVNNAFNGIDCGTLATGNYNFASSGRQNLKSTTSGSENSVGAGYCNLLLNTTGIGNSVGAGYQNLFSNTTGGYNTVGAGHNNLISNTIGFYNSVGSGTNNLFSNTSGNYNAVGSGRDNLRSNTTGSDNSVGSGRENLRLNTTGSNNAIGAGNYNLISNTTGTYNAVGAGTQNLNSNLSGNFNAVGAGFQNLYSNLSSENTVGAGFRNAYSNTTGTNIHVGAGYQNIFSNTTGTNNYVGAGRDCLYANVTGSFNSIGSGFEVFRFSNHNHLTGHGYKAGKNLIGNNNTSIGSLSNFTNDFANASSKTYTVATNNTITSTSHGFTVGSIVTFGAQLGTIANTAPPFYFKVLDANTLETYPNTLTNLTVGQTSTGAINIATVKDFSNTTTIGYNAQATKSNQVALGDANVTELLLGGTLALDKAALVAAADGTPLVIRTINGVKTITV